MYCSSLLEPDRSVVVYLDDLLGPGISVCAEFPVGLLFDKYLVAEFVLVRDAFSILAFVVR